MATLLAINILGHSSKPSISTHTIHDHGWRIRVVNDRFAGITTCDLKTRGIRYADQTLVFHVGGGDSDNALFRIDDGPARGVRETLVEDQKHGFHHELGWPNRLSDDEVALPVSYLAGARRITIRASTATRPRSFDLRGWPEALARAKAAGCAA